MGYRNIRVQLDQYTDVTQIYSYQAGDLDVRFAVVESTPTNVRLRAASGSTVVDAYPLKELSGRALPVSVGDAFWVGRNASSVSTDVVALVHTED